MESSQQTLLSAAMCFLIPALHMLFLLPGMPFPARWGFSSGPSGPCLGGGFGEVIALWVNLSIFAHIAMWIFLNLQHLLDESFGLHIWILPLDYEHCSACLASLQVSGAWYITDIKQKLNERVRLPDKANVCVIISALFWPETQIILRNLWLTNQRSTDKVTQEK